MYFYICTMMTCELSTFIAMFKSMLINSSPPWCHIYVSVNRVVISSDIGLLPIRPSHYLNKWRVIVRWTLRNKLQWNFNQNTKLFIDENASENIVCKMAAILSRERWVNNSCHQIRCYIMWIIMDFNSLRPGDAIWRHRSGSTLAQVMAWCLAAPSHYLNQCWLIISKV